MLHRNIFWVATTLFAITLTGCATPAADPVGTADQGYRSMIDAHASKAMSAGDVQGMTESALALYPLEVGTKTEKPKYVELLNAAADAVVAHKNTTEARKFTEQAGPLLTVVAKDKQQKIESLAFGKSTEDIAKQGSLNLAKELTKDAPALANPEIAARGDIRKSLAEAAGLLVLTYCRPSSALNEQTILSCDVDQRRGRADATIKIRWQGAFTGTKYTGVVYISLDLNPIDVRCISYTDNCMTPMKLNPNDIREAVNDILKGK